MSRPHIIVIGSTNTDMVVETPALPEPGETVLGGAFRMTPGGKGANQAVAAARAGGQVTFVTAVGDDTFGMESRERFVREGIETRYVFTKPGMPSGVALILVDACGENMIAVAPGANAVLTTDDLAQAAAVFHQARMVILQMEIPLESAIDAAARAAAAGCTVLLNPAPMPAAGLPDTLLRHVDILTPNEGELLALTPGTKSVEEAAARVLACGPEILVVTRGKRGAAVFTRDGAFEVPAIPVNAVDTVGAGDCFSACLGVALAEGHSLPDAVRFAVAAAGLSTTTPGAQEAMPERAAIERALGE
ncbi:MAG: ribokinase [Armatimonadota bacterium]